MGPGKRLRRGGRLLHGWRKGLQRRIRWFRQDDRFVRVRFQLRDIGQVYLGHRFRLRLQFERHFRSRLHFGVRLNHRVRHRW